MCRGSHMRVLALVNLVWLSESLSTAVAGDWRTRRAMEAKLGHLRA